MKILSIETSCDETAISIIDAKPNSLKKNGQEGGFKNPKFKIIANTIISQINIHKEFGGVFPALAKREHKKNLLPILKSTLKKAGLLVELKNIEDKNSKLQALNSKQIQNSNNKNPKLKIIERIFDKEIEMAEPLFEFIKTIKIPKIDAIAVTQGPGLEPALWTGINFAKALALLWNKPFIPVNHMEGHILASLVKAKNKNGPEIQFPAIALLLSGGHTEIVLMSDWMKYKTIGQTRDDAVGEAYDKVARMLNLEYPGGPKVSKLAEEFKLEGSAPKSYVLPRPMLNTPDLNFSFSGLKTAVLYMVKSISKITPEIKKEICFEFENAVVDVLLKKTKKALEKNNIKTLIIGGGVSANKRIRKEFKKLEKEIAGLNVLIPEKEHSTDNAVMIGIAGYFRFLDGKVFDPNKTEKIKANGNLRLSV